MAKANPATSPVQRRRAPRRKGYRTTLTVPFELSAVAKRLAKALGTTETDAVVHLGLLGAAVYERQETLASRAHARREAVLAQARKTRKPAYPPAGEAREAVLAARHEEE